VFVRRFGSQGEFARFEQAPESARDADWCALPQHNTPKPRPRTPPPPPRADSAQAAAAEMGSGSGGESCHAQWTARRPRLGLREVSQDRVLDVVVGDERDDPHLATARRAQQRVDLINTLDKLRPAPAESAGVGAVIPGDSSRGRLLAIARRSLSARSREAVRISSARDCPWMYSRSSTGRLSVPSFARAGRTPATPASWQVMAYSLCSCSACAREDGSWEGSLSKTGSSEPGRSWR